MENCARARARALLFGRDPLFASTLPKYRREEKTVIAIRRKREQSRTSGGKAVNLATANKLQFIASSISALPRFRGQWVDPDRIGGVCNARRSAHGPSVDWQVWGTKRGLCWRATRDGLRHVPAGPPKSPSGENPSTLASRDTRQLRFSARRATISVEYVSQSIQTKTTRETALLNRNSLLRRAPSAGAGKNALFSSRGLFARGVLGVGVRAPDSHALSNTWESVQKTGLLRSGVFFEINA